MGSLYINPPTAINHNQYILKKGSTMLNMCIDKTTYSYTIIRYNVYFDSLIRNIWRTKVDEIGVDTMFNTNYPHSTPSNPSIISTIKVFYAEDEDCTEFYEFTMDAIDTIDAIDAKD